LHEFVPCSVSFFFVGRNQPRIARTKRHHVGSGNSQFHTPPSLGRMARAERGSVDVFTVPQFGQIPELCSPVHCYSPGPPVTLAVRLSCRRHPFDLSSRTRRPQSALMPLRV